MLQQSHVENDYLFRVKTWKEIVHCLSSHNFVEKILYFRSARFPSTSYMLLINFVFQARFMNSADEFRDNNLSLQINSRCLLEYILHLISRLCFTVRQEFWFKNKIKWLFRFVRFSCLLRLWGFEWHIVFWIIYFLRSIHQHFRW